MPAVTDLAPPDRFFRILRGSGGEENASAEQVEAGPSIHLALDEFELVHLSFGLPIAPGESERRLDCLLVLLQTGGKGLDGADPRGVGIDQSGVQHGFGINRCFAAVDAAGTDQVGKAMRQRKKAANFLVLFSPSEHGALRSVESLWRLDQQPGDLVSFPGKCVGCGKLTRGLSGQQEI